MKLFGSRKPAAPDSPDAPGISFLLEAATASPPVPLEATLYAWAMRDLAPWRRRGISRAQAHARLHEINNTKIWATLFQIAHGRVAHMPKPDALLQTGGYKLRTEQYFEFLSTIAVRMPANFTTLFLVNLKDFPTEDIGVPQFAMQRGRNGNAILLPDYEFLGNDFYAGYDNDAVPFAKKENRAVFVGSTAGGMINPELARNNGTPRLAAAAAFWGNKRVDFRLPIVAQTNSEEARAILEAKPYCQASKLEWEEQLKARFLISMDGNGLPFSRMAQALLSHSVLLQYASDFMLYYSDGLLPWLHYVPVTGHGDVEAVLDLAAVQPKRFEAMAAASRAFAQVYLTRQAASAYTLLLLREYEASFRD